MTLQSVDTAEMPRARPVASVATPEPALRRARHARRSERRAQRRRRRLYAFGGLAVLVAFLCATVAVVDMVR